MTQYLNSIGLTWQNENDENFPQEPALEGFASYFNGFNPIGKIEEEKEKQFIYKKGDSFNKIWQYLLNDKLEIQIGEIIFKFINKENFFIILDNDLESLDILRSKNDLLDGSYIRNTFFINTNVLEDKALLYRLTKFEDKGFFEKYWDPNDDCKVEIVIIPYDNDIYRIYAISYSKKIKNYHWKIYNNHGIKVVDKDTHSGIIDVHLTSNNVSSYNVYLEAYSRDKSCIAKDMQTISVDNCDCNYDFNIRNTDYYYDRGAEFDVFRINLTGVDYSCGYDLLVNWGDGTTEVYHNISNNTDIKHYYILNPNSPNNLPNGTTEFNVVVKLIGSSCKKFRSKKILVGCGDKVSDIHGEKEYQSNPRRKLVYELEMDYAWFLQSYTYFNIKATNKKKFFGFWKKTKAKKLEADVLISRITFDCSQYSDLGKPLFVEDNKSKLRVMADIFDTKDVTVKPGYVSVDFYVTGDNNIKHGPFNLTW